MTVAQLLICILTATTSATGAALPDCTDGFLRLDAVTYANIGTDDFYWNQNCALIGQPGTVIKDSFLALNFKLGGTLQFQNVTMIGQIIAESAAVDFKDCEIRQGSLLVNGSIASWTHGSMWFSAGVVRIVGGSNATLTDISFSTNVGEFSIDASNVIMEDVGVSMGYHCPQMSNSTVILNRSSLFCKMPEETWSIQHSVLKLTQSTLELIHESSSDYGSLAIVDSAVDATCDKDFVIRTSGSSEYEKPKPHVSITNSTMNFNNCSCQSGQRLTVDGPISTSGALHIKRSSLEFGECTPRASTQLGARTEKFV